MAIFKGAKDRNETFVGSDASDRFLFDPADLNRRDSVVGGDGSGKDSLIFTAPGSIAAAALANVSGIETIVLAGGGCDIVLVQSLLDTAMNRALTVKGGDGGDTISARLIQDQGGPGSIELLGGRGDDVIKGPEAQGNLDCYIDGGAGSDSIDASDAAFVRIVYDGRDRQAFASQGTLIVNGAATIDLARARDQSANDTCIVRGFASVDASASRASVSISSDGYGPLIGGHAADVIRGMGLVVGGGGADTLVGGSFVINPGDFVAGESIAAASGSAGLTVYGDADFSKGTLVGIYRLSVNQDPSGSSGAHVVFNDDQISNVHFVDGDRINSITVKVGDDHIANIDTLVANGDIDVIGSSAADEISAMGSSVVIHGLGGDDILYMDTPVREDAAVYGDDGDDLISGNVDGVRAMLDGGAGIDTLRLFGDASGVVEIDLSRVRNQGVSGTGILTGFENVDFSTYDRDVIVTGSNRDNVISGGYGSDVIRGGYGNDTLSVGIGNGNNKIEGGAGDDLIIAGVEFSTNELTGGRGSDTFFFSDRPEATFQALNRITDFRPDVDRLEFDQIAFAVAGESFDTLVIAADATVDITGADLVIYRGTLDVDDYLNQAVGGRRGDGIFVVSRNDHGDAMLYYSTDSNYADFDENIFTVANLGDFGKLTNLTLNDFSFI